MSRSVRYGQRIGTFMTATAVFCPRPDEARAGGTGRNRDTLSQAPCRRQPRGHTPAVKTWHPEAELVEQRHTSES